MQNIDNLRGHPNINVTTVRKEYYSSFDENQMKFEENKLKCIKYLDKHGRLSRLPLESHANATWYFDNFFPLYPGAWMGSRPAIILYDEQGNLELIGYAISGLLHREDGPAVIYFKDGTVVRESYFLLDMKL